MKRQFLLSCGSTADLPYSYLQERGIPVIFYTYSVDGKEYVDDMGRDPEALPEFYKFLADGKLPLTSQINTGEYYDFFEEQLQKGDLMHIAFGSGMSNSVNNAQEAAEMLHGLYFALAHTALLSDIFNRTYVPIPSYEDDALSLRQSFQKFIERFIEYHII